MSKNQIVKLLQYVLFLGGGIALVWWQLRGMSEAHKTEFMRSLRTANYWLILPVVLMNLLSHYIRSMRWRLLLQPLGYKPKRINLFAATMAGYLANSAVPRLGEVLKCSLLAKYEKLETDKLIGTILLERIFDLICYALLIAITVLIQFDVVGSYTKEKLEAVFENGISIGTIAIILGIIAIIFASRILVRRFPQSKPVKKVRDFFKGIGTGFRAVWKLEKRTQFILLTVLMWGLYLAQIRLGFEAIGATELLGWKAACSVLTLSTLAMIITPNGIGVFPLLVMETLIIYAIAPSAGKALGWLIWGTSTVIIIIVGLLALILLPLLNRTPHEGNLGHQSKNL